jgi:hypothetical protein
MDVMQRAKLLLLIFFYLKHLINLAFALSGRSVFSATNGNR